MHVQSYARLCTQTCIQQPFSVWARAVLHSLIARYDSNERKYPSLVTAPCRWPRPIGATQVRLPQLQSGAAGVEGEAECCRAVLTRRLSLCLGPNAPLPVRLSVSHLTRQQTHYNTSTARAQSLRQSLNFSTRLAPPSRRRNRRVLQALGSRTTTLSDHVSANPKPKLHKTPHRSQDAGRRPCR